MATTTTDNASELLLLFDRPTEPIFMVKNETTWFQVPQNYLSARYQSIHGLTAAPLAAPKPVTIGTPPDVSSSPADPDDSIQYVNVKPTTLPDLSEIMQLGRRENFSLFLPSHRKISSNLIDIFYACPTIADLISVASYCRDRVNPLLFNYALSVAILHRTETNHLQLPSLYEVFPQKFLSTDVLVTAKEEATLPTWYRRPIDIEQQYATGSGTNMEHRLAYFREDIGVNLHHWHWHLVYPHNKMLDKDRRGELFYYMHQQILARYDMERVCNNLNFVKKLINWREALEEEGYYPKLDTSVGSKNWPARCAKSKLKDIDRSDTQLDIADLENWRNRILTAIHQGYLIDDKDKKINLTEKDGIDILGNVVESSDISKNKSFYGNLHNMGHVLISYCHDPEEKHLQSFGVMGDTATAMRDPIFYQWHSFIDSIFQQHKHKLSSYNNKQLHFPGVRVISLKVTSNKQPENQLVTYWEKSDINFSRGLDFSPRGPVLAKIKHLQHEEFTYSIQVECDSVPAKCTVRIFMAPKFDQHGSIMKFSKQRTKFVEMDKFVHTIEKKKETIIRQSIKSSVTIPYEQIFRNLDVKPKNKKIEGKSNYCGCGWPHYMLLPKGTADGFPCILFVMLTNFEEDYVGKVEQPPDIIKPGECVSAFSFCGLKNKNYPDSRPMGYPFDRKTEKSVEWLSQFMTPNMFTTEVKIVHHNKVVK